MRDPYRSGWVVDAVQYGAPLLGVILFAAWQAGYRWAALALAVVLAAAVWIVWQVRRSSRSRRWP